MDEEFRIKKENLLRRAEIIKTFKESVIEIFKDNLIFGFISGSFATNQDTSNSDIDMFIIVQELDELQRSIFLETYTRLHQLHNRVIDEEFKFELCDIKTLELRLEVVETELPRCILRKDIDDGLVWSSMLSKSKVGEVGNMQIIEDLVSRAKKVIQNWYPFIIKN